MKTNKTNESANVQTNVQTNVQVTNNASEQNKVTAKDAIKSISKIAAYVRTERKGVNATIRILMDAAQNGDADAINTLCALCDVPTDMAHAITLEDVRHAVNAYYPYYIEKDNRRISVKPVGVWYSTKNDNETQEDASQRVQRGYRAVAVVDYLDMLIKAAKCRAKGITPRCVDSNAIYSDIALSETADDITCNEIDEAKERKSYLAGAVNIWKKDRNGFYI